MAGQGLSQRQPENAGGGFLVLDQNGSAWCRRDRTPTEFHRQDDGRFTVAEGAWKDHSLGAHKNPAYGICVYWAKYNSASWEISENGLRCCKNGFSPTCGQWVGHCNGKLVAGQGRGHVRIQLSRAENSWIFEVVDIANSDGLNQPSIVPAMSPATRVVPPRKVPTLGLPKRKKIGVPMSTVMPRPKLEPIPESNQEDEHESSQEGGLSELARPQAGGDGDGSDDGDDTTPASTSSGAQNAT